MRRLLSKTLYFLFGWLALLATTLLMMTCRVRVFGREIERQYRQAHPGKPLLYASWHRGLLYFVYFYRRLKFVVMASASRDGELAAQITKRFEWLNVRGSSSSGGSTAFRQMLALVNAGHNGGLVVDAPRGPSNVSKKGIILLAQKAKVPIIPVMWSADRCWRVRSWDRTIIPKPFARIVFLYGDQLLHVPPECSADQIEHLRRRLDDILNRMMHQVDHFHAARGISNPRHISIPLVTPEGGSHAEAEMESQVGQRPPVGTPGA